MHLSGMPPAAVGLIRVRNSLWKEFLPAEKHIIRAKVLFSQPFILIWTKPEPSSGSNTFYKPSHATSHFKIQGLGGLFTFNIQKICEGKAWINVLQQNLLWLHTRGEKITSLGGAALFTQRVGSFFQQHPLTSWGSGWNWQRVKQSKPNASFQAPKTDFYNSVVCWERMGNRSSQSSHSKSTAGVAPPAKREDYVH